MGKLLSYLPYSPCRLSDAMLRHACLFVASPRSPINRRCPICNCPQRAQSLRLKNLHRIQHHLRNLTLTRFE